MFGQPVGTICGQDSLLVRFLNDKLNAGTIRNLMTRAGQEVIGEF